MSTTNNGQEAKTEPKKSQALVKIEALQSALSTDFVSKSLTAALGEAAPAFSASLIEIVTTDSYLSDCDPRKVVLQALKAAALRLPLSKQLGQAWIIAYDGEPQFQIGYKGLIQLGIRSGKYKTMNADAVYEGEYRLIDRLAGTFDLNGQRKSDKVIGYFAYFELLNGFQKMMYMTVKQVDDHAKKYSKSYNNKRSPWKNEFDAMGIKTQIRLLLTHWGYLSPEMAEAIKSDLDYDAADDAMEEIRGKGNTKTTGFTDFETVPPETDGDQKQGNNNQQQGGGPGW